MTNLINIQTGTAKADKDILLSGSECVIAFRLDTVRTRGQQTSWMNGPVDALARDASNRRGHVVRHAQGRYRNHRLLVDLGDSLDQRMLLRVAGCSLERNSSCIIHRQIPQITLA